MFSDWRLDKHDDQIIALIRIIMIKDKKVDTMLCVQVIVGTLDMKLCVQPSVQAIVGTWIWCKRQNIVA